MKKQYVNDSLNKFDGMVGDHLQDKKKILALQNYGVSASERSKRYLDLLKDCYEHGFLEEKEKGFLDHLVSKYEMKNKYFVWCYKTKWVKQQIESKARALRQQAKLRQPSVPQYTFSLAMFTAKAAAHKNVPVELLNQSVTSANIRTSA